MRLSDMMRLYMNGTKTYLPHKAAADVSKHREPIGRKRGIQ